MLDQLAIKYQTDKSSLHHNYTPIYESYFGGMRNEPFTMLEMGFGGYRFYDRGGESLRMWRNYFYKARIISIDLYPKAPVEGVEFYQGSQTDEEFLKRIVPQDISLIIDDASHNSPNSIRSFEILWPLMPSGSTYVLEDLEAAYWDNDEFQGGLDNPQSSMNFLKSLTDTLNHGHSGREDQGIDSIHFHRKIVFIKKK